MFGTSHESGPPLQGRVGMRRFSTDDPNEFVLGRGADGQPLTTYLEVQTALATGEEVSPPIHPLSGKLERPDPTPRGVRSGRRGRGAMAPTREALPFPAPVPAPPPETPGSASWWATTTLGSEGRVIDTLEAIISGQGTRADRRWVQLTELFRHWEQQFLSGALPYPPTLNQAVATLSIPIDALIPFLQTNLTRLALTGAQVRMAMGADKLVGTALQSANDIENGFQDRKLLFEALGLTFRSPLVQVNQANTTNISTAPVAAQPKALRNLSNTLDASIREAEGEIIDAEVVDVQ